MDELINQYDLDRKVLLHGLESLGIQFSTDESLKQIAARNQTNPIELYERIKTAIRQ